METFTDYLATLNSPQHRARMEEVFTHIAERFPGLAQRIAWNQPMFTDHGTFIIGLSAAKAHMAVAPEQAGMVHFAQQIAQAGYTQTKELFRIPWNAAVDYALLERIIAFNRLEKADCDTFWRK